MSAGAPPVAVRVDFADERLWRGRQPIGLRPKTFGVLRVLVSRAGRLILKRDLLDEVWGSTAVSDVVLMVCIRELRQALADETATPRFIETVHRRGYRFVGTVTAESGSARAQVTLTPRSVSASVPVAAADLPVGRGPELTWLGERLDAARRGDRQVVFVTGEAGVGKTTLVDAFVLAAGASEDIWIGRGQCIEHHGPAEAYLPILEALTRLGQCGDDRVGSLLARHAPTWLAHLPALATGLDGGAPTVSTATRGGMLRELADALEVVTAHAPVVLVLDDLHWSDHSTVDVVTALARRRTPARLLLIGMYRPADALRAGHPLQIVKAELLAHGQAAELPVGFLGEESIAAYLVARLPGLPRRNDVARIVHRRTEGNPLFMINLLASWRSRGLLIERGDRWDLAADPDALGDGVPASLRELVERRVDALGPEEQRLLEAASVVGVEFAAAVVAAALGRDVATVEASCAALARSGQFLRQSGEAAWPDGTVSAAYAFLHAVYQEVVYDRVTPACRTRLHERVAACEEVAYVSQLDERAATLAVHFERAADRHRAITYRQRAAAVALRRHAYADAAGHLARALELLGRLPDNRHRAEQELAIRIAMGPALMATRGYGAPDVERTYRRARELCRRLRDDARLVPVLLGLRQMYSLRAKLTLARRLSEECLGLGHRAADRAVLIEARLGLAVTACFQGRFAEAQRHADRGFRLYDPGCDGRTRSGADVSGMGCLAYGALARWFRGQPGRALERIGAAVALADKVGDPFSRAYAFVAAAWLHQFRRDTAATLASAEMAVAVSQAHGFPLREAQGTILAGWALAASGDSEAGIARMREGLARFRATGAVLNVTYYLALLAEAHAERHALGEALRVLDEAFIALDRGAECWWAAELHRLRALLRWRRGRAGDRIAATRDVRRALLVARRQRARPLERRAMASRALIMRAR